MTNNQKTILFDGRKAVRIDDLPDSAWTWFSGRGSEEQQKTRTFYIRVPWLSRGVTLRSNAISSLPFALVDTGSGEDYDVSTNWENKVGFLPNPSKLLALVESSLTLLGMAYLFNERNRVKTLDLRYFAPTTITPELDPITGLVGFKRNIGSQSFPLTPEDVIHFWQLDPFVELGPGNNSAATAALSAAGVLYNVDGFADAFFERGAIKVTLLTTQGPMPEQERKRLKDWWSRVVGSKNAFSSRIVQSEAVKPVVIGEGVQELSDSELTKEKREDIAAALGIPMTIMWSSEASGLGGGGVVQSDERKFYEQTIVPEALFIQAVFNEQLFEPLGLRWQFRPETLDVFQADENARSQSLVNYVNAGYRLSLASQVLGVELPPGVEYDDLDEMKQEDKEQAIANMQDSFGGNGPPGQGKDDDKRPPNLREKAIRDDLAKWERKALNKGAGCSFESEFIPAALAAQVRVALDGAGSDEEIKAVFASKAVRFIPDGADEPLLPVPDNIEWDEADIARASERWDKLMPQYRGMLDADVEAQVEFDGEQY